MTFIPILNVLKSASVVERHRVEEVLMRTAANYLDPINPVGWGYKIMYHSGESHRCPGCGHSN